MELQKEIEALNYSQEELKNRLDKDTQKKLGAILDILEIGKPSIAHSKLVLHICEDLLEKCSLTFGTKTDV